MKKIDETEWVSYKHPKYEEAEFVEIGGRKGHILSHPSHPFKIARVMVGDGWDLYKVIRSTNAKDSVRKVLMYLLREMGPNKSLIHVDRGIPNGVEMEYSDIENSSFDEVESWFKGQM